MRFNSLRSVVSSAALMLVFGVLLSASAMAQGNWTREHTRDYAYKLGYHQAYSEAADYVKTSGRRISVRDLPGYRNDVNGYLVYMGNREDYRSSYRRGYEQGFNDAVNGRPRRYGKTAVEAALGGRLKDVYNDDRYDQEDWYNGRRDDRDRGGDWRDRDRNGRNDRNDTYRVAQQNGYREGLRQGRDDSYRRRSFNYENDRLYRDALNGYRSEYGNRDDYRRAFREGFRQGYEEGYRNRR